MKDYPEESSLSPTEAETPPSGKAIAKAIAREVAETVFLAIVLVLLIQLVVRNFRVDGQSMEPNLHHNQYLVVDRLSYKAPVDLLALQRGDVVVFASPVYPHKDFVKRIIGLPGDTVELKGGQVFVNNALFENNFGAWLDHSSMPPQVVPENALFVMGDNRANSNDSRMWGMLAMEELVGRAWFSYWPPQYWGLIPHDAPTHSSTAAEESTAPGAKIASQMLTLPPEHVIIR